MVGATKPHHMEGAARAVELSLTPEECAYLEEPYTPHKLVGVMEDIGKILESSCSPSFFAL